MAQDEDDDFGMPAGFGDGQDMTRRQRIRGLGDTELLKAYSQLHHPSLVADALLSLLEDEIRSRGLSTLQ